MHLAGHLHTLSPQSVPALAFSVAHKGVSVFHGYKQVHWALSEIWPQTVQAVGFSSHV